ncbi:MAG: hypothetical protein HYR58_00480 [Acidobacteria bacterium]|nr:hypothetical protein [Acidobacteriota bacterium]
MVFSTNRLFLLGVLLVSLAMLSYETLLPRVFAVYVGPNFVYFLISIALVGLSSGGIIASIWEERFSENPYTHLAAASILFAVCVFLATWLTYEAGSLLNATLDARYTKELAAIVDRARPIPAGIIVVPSMLFVLVVGVLTAVPFLFAGLCLSLAFRYGSSALGKIYGYDLVGAGLGCALTVGSLTWLSATNALVLVSVLAGAAALCFAYHSRAERGPAHLRLATATLAVFTALLLFGVLWRSPFEFRIHQFAHLRSYLDGPAEETEFKWTPLGRISLLHRQWSPPLNLTPRVRPKHFVAMDLGGHSVVETFSPENLAEIKHTSVFSDDVPETVVIPGSYRPQIREYLVLMAGNGQDMMRAYAWYGDQIRLEGVELNPTVYEMGFDYPQANLRAFFEKPNVKMRIAEGRAFVERSEKTYDLILLSYSGATFATGTGSLASTPQFLFTKEAFVEYLKKLSPAGVLIVAGGSDPGELPPSLRTFVAALREVSPGSDPRRHVISYQLKGAPSTSHYTIYHKSPLSEEEMPRIKSVLDANSLELTYSAFTLPTYAPVEQYFSSASLDSAASLWKFRPLAGDRIHADNQPFYYFNLIWGTLGGYLVLGYIGTLLAALFAAILFLVVPLAVVRRSSPPSSRRVPWYYLCAFALLGSGFILIEVGSIQKFELFLGQPTLTLVVILSMLLIWTGVGSYWSNRLFDSGVLSVRKSAFAILVYGAAALYFLNSLIYHLMGLPLAAKILVIAAVLSPLGLLLGTLFPQLLRQLGPEQGRFIPLAWGLNGIFSVVASNLGAILYLFLGASTVFFLGLACYAILGILAHVFSLKADPEAPDRLATSR